MKKISGNILKALLAILIVAFFLPGCYETHYYHHYNHHTRGWYDHRHREPPQGVNFEIDVYKRGHRK
ncbi:MAG TPA: hypothetical protein VK588_05920 [Chitinophagaceae bacterium]|nr:hypothetical protein [Chitinophagaceae bacterium]